MPTRLVLTICLGLVSVAADPAQEPAVVTERNSKVLATVGSVAITDTMVEERAAERLTRIRSEEYALKKQVLDEYIAEVLLQQEASVRGISVAELERREITATAAPVTADATRAVLESNPQQFQGRSETEALAQIGARLRRSREAETRRNFVISLRARSSVRVLLAPPRVAVSTKGQPSRGPEDAPVTLVVFSDYQCPYCARLEPTLRQLERRYEKQLKVVFRDFPLEQIHSNATRAAEATACAMDQGKFWPMHSKLFEDQKALSAADLKRTAAAIGLQATTFSECLDSGRKAQDWQQDVRDGQRYGVTGTPSIFINGRMFRGAATEQTLSEVVEEEIAAAGRR